MARQRSVEPALITVQRASADETSSLTGSSDEDEGPEYVVEAILKRRITADGDVEYQIKWEGYEGTSEETSWEPEEASCLARVASALADSQLSYSL